MGFLPFILNSLHFYFAFASWPDWTGYVFGAEFSILDGLALGLYFSLPRARTSFPFRYSMALYFLAVLISALHAQVPIPALFVCWQLARMFFLYAVVSRACAANLGVVSALLTGMGVALIMEASIATWQRFALGELQAGGSLGQQNILGLVSHFVVFPYFAMLLTRERRWLPVLIVLAGVVVEILTTSRATLGLAALGYALVFIFSALKQWTPRKLQVLLVAIAAIAILIPVATSSLGERGYTAMERSSRERAAFIEESQEIISDNPWGVGANNYVHAAVAGRYYEKANLDWFEALAIVHNSYLLTTAETGYLGLIAFVIFLIRPLFVAFRCGWRCRRDIRGELLLALGVSLLIVYLHAAFEFVFLTFVPQYLLVLELGMVAGLAQQLGYWRRQDASQPTRPVVKRTGVGLLDHAPRQATKRTDAIGL
jgi:O-antigen ligase